MTDHECQDTPIANVGDDHGYEIGKKVAPRKRTLSRRCTWSQAGEPPIAARPNGPALPVIWQAVSTLSALAGQVSS
jgi:hypothetical protein